MNYKQKLKRQHLAAEKRKQEPINRMVANSMYLSYGDAYETHHRKRKS